MKPATPVRSAAITRSVRARPRRAGKVAKASALIDQGLDKFGMNGRARGSFRNRGRGLHLHRRKLRRTRRSLRPHHGHAAALRGVIVATPEIGDRTILTTVRDPIGAGKVAYPV